MHCVIMKLDSSIKGRYHIFIPPPKKIRLPPGYKCFESLKHIKPVTYLIN